jgi:uncharacterized protein YbaR (Trm112 family)
LESKNVTAAELDAAAALPVLTPEILACPVMIESIELLYNGRFYTVRTRSKDGAEGIAVTNDKAAYLYPILQQRVIPFFLNKDARDLEALIDGVFVANSNYKLAGLALWCCIAWVEFSMSPAGAEIPLRSKKWPSYKDELRKPAPARLNLKWAVE